MAKPTKRGGQGQYDLDEILEGAHPVVKAIFYFTLSLFIASLFAYAMLEPYDAATVSLLNDF